MYIYIHICIYTYIHIYIYTYICVPLLRLGRDTCAYERAALRSHSSRLTISTDTQPNTITQPQTHRDALAEGAVGGVGEV